MIDKLKHSFALGVAGGCVLCAFGAICVTAIPILIASTVSYSKIVFKEKFIKTI